MPRPKLATLFAHLHSQAQRTGRDQHATLAGGARIAVRVADGETTLTLARSPQRVGDREIITFKAQCGVPADAQRWPQEGQQEVEREGKHWCAWRFGGLSRLSRKRRSIYERAHPAACASHARPAA